MKEQIVDFFALFPDHVATFLIAMLPIAELRLAIPIGITVYHMDPLEAYFYAVLGNIFVGIITLVFVENVIHLFLNRSHTLNRLWQRYIDRLHVNNKESFEKWGAVGLVLFIAIPLPMTGVISGAIVASIFQIPFRQAVPLLAIGATIAGVIATLITAGAVRVF